MGYRDGQGAGKASHIPIAATSRLGRLRIRAKLYLAFSAISSLVIASAIAATIWMSNRDANILRDLSLADFAERQSTVVELNMMTMSDAMRGYLLNPSSQIEHERKLAADAELTKVVEELKIPLAEMPGVLHRIIEIEAYDDQILNRTENRLLDMAQEDIEAAKRFYETDYLPLRERATELILALRHEIAQVKEAVRVEAAETRAKQLVLALSGIAVILMLSGLVAWLSGQAIAGQIRAMTTAMGRLAAGDTTIDIPAQDSKDEIGDMAKAVDVFKQNMIRADQLAIERGLIEQKLAQAQKMEAIGNLTGGIAHDFNNLLTVIVGNVSMIEHFVEDPVGQRQLRSALKAGESAVALTQRLLAFARKQDLQLLSVDLLHLVAGMRSLLLRTLGDDVRLVIDADGAPWPTMVDPNQMEMIILNLAINARDAMPDGGTLSIAFSNREGGRGAPHDLAPVDYVVLTMTDTGIGMDAATLARATEPFFTTKSQDRGTGLGLSMMEGVIAQSGGATRLRSTPGQGTEVELWLPRTKTPPIRATVSREQMSSAAEGGETILVCDDNPAVLEFLCDALNGAGYHTIDVQSGELALSALRADPSIQLLVADFAMPEMNGAVLLGKVRALYPELPALLITGNADLDAVQAEIPGMPILAKPFGHEQLAARVGELLKRTPVDA